LMAVYYASKAYVLSFTEALAEELRGSGVTATALCPGPTTSGFQERAAMESSRLVSGRLMMTSEEVAEAGYPRPPPLPPTALPRPAGRPADRHPRLEEPAPRPVRARHAPEGDHRRRPADAGAADGRAQGLN